MIESFASAVGSATLEEKRRLLRTIVKKVVWDGKNAYVYLFAEDGEADLPPVEQPMYPLGEDSEINTYRSDYRRKKIYSIPQILSLHPMQAIKLRHYRIMQIRGKRAIIEP